MFHRSNRSRTILLSFYTIRVVSSSSNLPIPCFALNTHHKRNVVDVQTLIHNFHTTCVIMPPAKKFYAVSVGRTTGVFESWREAEQQVKGFHGAKHKSFKTKEEAETYIANGTSNLNDKKGDVKNDKKRPISEDNNDNVGKNQQQKQQHVQINKSIKISINFDGGSRGNPGIAGAGAAITINEISKSSEEAKSAFRRVLHVRNYLGDSFTNNEAEYQGVEIGLRIALCEAKQLCPSGLETTLIIQGDSDLAIKQLKREYQCRNPRLEVRCNRVRSLVNELKRLGICKESYEHVYREFNQVADALANEAMDTRESWVTTSDDDHQTRYFLESYTE